MELLSAEEKERYSRQIMLEEIGEEGQLKLKAAKVLIVGVGGLGSPVALYLAGAGVGTLGLVDDDVVSRSNLQRQVLYLEAETGEMKVFCARKRLLSLNQTIQVDAYPVRLTADNADKIIGNYDIVVDGCDNFTTRYLMDDTCARLGKVYVYGAIREFDGQVSVFNGREGFSYRNLFPEEKEMRDVTHLSKAVLGITPGLVGAVEANETLKLILGYGDVLSGKLWHIDLKTLETHTIFL